MNDWMSFAGEAYYSILEYNYYTYNYRLCLMSILVMHLSDWDWVEGHRHRNFWKKKKM